MWTVDKVDILFMLENLLNSQTKRRVLNVFFHYPNRSFHVNELRAMELASGSTLDLMLRELARAEVLQVAAKKHQRYFRINPRFKLYDELKDLVGEQRLPAADEVSKRLKRLTRAKLIVLSGIFTLAPHLPADLLVVGDDINRRTLLKIILEIEKLAGQEINYTVMDRGEYDYRRTMNDRFLRDIFDYNHIVVTSTLKKGH